ncbi:unnamed protein product [Brassica oleracea]
MWWHEENKSYRLGSDFVAWEARNNKESVVSSKARYCYYKKPKGKLSNSWMFVAELGMISTKMPAPITFRNFPGEF